jgi:hypothetical protein
VELKSTFVDARRASAGDFDSMPLTVTNGDIVNEPADGFGIGRGWRDKRVGPRCMWIEGGGIVADDDGIPGTTE